MNPKCWYVSIFTAGKDMCRLFMQIRMRCWNWPKTKKMYIINFMFVCRTSRVRLPLRNEAASGAAAWLCLSKYIFAILMKSLDNFTNDTHWSLFANNYNNTQILNVKLKYRAHTELPLVRQREPNAHEIIKYCSWRSDGIQCLHTFSTCSFFLRPYAFRYNIYPEWH